MAAPVATPAAEARRVRAVQALGLLETGPDERFDRIVRIAARMMGTPIAALSLLDTDQQWFKATVGLDPPTMPRTASVCSTVVEQASPLVVEDLTADSRFGAYPLIGRAGLRFYAGVPLRAPDEEVVGALCVIDRVPRTVSPEGIEGMLDLASVAETELALRSLAHEVRTPVAAILGYAEELQDPIGRPMPEAARDEAVAAIARDARRLRALAEHMQSGGQPGGVKR